MIRSVARLVILLFMASLPLQADDDHFSVTLKDVQKVQDSVYAGTAGKAQLTVYTGDCFHDTTKNESAYFTWLGNNGMITFYSNEDTCRVKSYKKN